MYRWEEGAARRSDLSQASRPGSDLQLLHWARRTTTDRVAAFDQSRLTQPTYSEAAALYEQLQRLQAIVQDRCPDVAIDEVLSGPPTRISNAITAAGNPPPQQSTSSIAAYQDTPRLRDTSTRYTRASGGTQVDDADHETPRHEIGLVPLTPGVSKYVGPSSGFNFARLVFAKATKCGDSPDAHRSKTSMGSPTTVRSGSALQVAPTSVPDTVEDALLLSKIYFEHVHIHYPFLHEPSYIQLLNRFYSGHAQSETDKFQVTMVLSISAVICSRRLRIRYSGEGICATAMQKVDQIDFQNSLQGVQCLLLILMFTSYSPFLGLDPWYLNYQCLASVLDLGLQRDLPTSSSCTVFERELRTRTFWSIYTIDRNLATKLGRPIGLRDEACELRMPAELEDDELQTDLMSMPSRSRSVPGPLACSRVLFELALLNSEIKYILHSISRNVPRYTYPQVPDVEAWQADLHERLQAVISRIPPFADAHTHLKPLCQLQYLEIVMLLFRPSPRIRKPSQAALLECQRSAESQLRVFRELYDSNWLPFSWSSIHSICLAAITLLYCVWSEPSIAATAKIDKLMDDLRVASNLLSAAGEHWPEARRSRDHLEQLSSATVRWLLDLHTTYRPPSTAQPQRQRASGQVDQGTFATAAASQLPDLGDMSFDWDFPGIETYLDNENLATFVGAPDPFTAGFNMTIDGMFSEYQPTFDSGI